MSTRYCSLSLSISVQFSLGTVVENICRWCVHKMCMWCLLKCIVIAAVGQQHNWIWIFLLCVCPHKNGCFNYSAFACVREERNSILLFSIACICACLILCYVPLVLLSASCNLPLLEEKLSICFKKKKKRERQREDMYLVLLKWLK